MHTRVPGYGAGSLKSQESRTAHQKVPGYPGTPGYGGIRGNPGEDFLPGYKYQYPGTGNTAPTLE
eukprot:1886027-Rhodomonas_salina.1